MIPILYAGNEQSFLNNGLGRLSDAISCKVTEERNGVFELEMTYPITGIHFADIAENCIIYAKTEDGGNNQAFIIYKISKPLNGIVTINAQHISYLLNGFIVFPFTATSLSDAMSQIVANTTPASIPFTFYTDIVSNVRFTLDTPRTVRGLLGGQSGSLLDVYGGYDYKFDNFTVRLLANRGMDRGVTIRYGKNLTSLKNVNDMTSVYTGIVPYWADSEGNTVYLTEKVVYSQYASLYPYKIIKTVDFSSDFDSQPTEAQLRQKAQAYIENNNGWKIKNNIDVSFVALSQSEEYKNIAPLENVKLCDTVTIRYDKLGVNTSARVIKTVYNVLLERYDSITLGDTTYTLAQAIQGEIDAPTMSEVRSFTQSAVEHATKLIQGGLGGHVVFNTNGDGEPEEILIMDTDDITTARYVIRFNLAGIGFSTTGYNGPFTNAWTIDGNLVADFITTGSLNAALITVGTLKDAQNRNYWDMTTGEFKLTAGAKIGNSDIASTQNVADGDSNTLNSANSAADTKIDNYNTSLNQQAVFKKLTNNEQNQGIYLVDTKLYINGEYIKANSIAANALTVDAKDSLQEKHSYVGDIYDDISLWHNDGNTVPFSYQTISGTKYLVLDCTGTSGSSVWNNVVYTKIDAIGDAKVRIKATYYIDRAITISAAQPFPVVRYKKATDGQYYNISGNLAAQTIPANTEQSIDVTLSPIDVDGAADNYCGFYPINGCKIYIKELTITTTMDDYAKAGIEVNAQGISSSVQKGSVISSINQSSEMVSINANKIDLSGALSLHGDFTSYKAGGSDPEYYKLMMDASSLKFYADGQLSGKIEPVYNGSYYSIELTCYDRDTGRVLSSIGPSGVSVTSNGAGSVSTDILYVNGFNGPSIFFREVEFAGSGGAGVTFKGSVYDANGSTVFVSDKRKKKNIKDLAIEKARSFIMALKPREFKFKKEIANAGRKHHGFIAQEVKEVMHEDWGLYVEDKSKDYIGLRYTEIIADMVAVIQDQQKRIEALERRVNDITNNQP